jgi:NADPH2:quinone reductase
MSEHDQRGHFSAVQYERTGGPETLKLIDRPLRDPGPGEVRVLVHRSGVNPTDWKSRQGGPQPEPVTPPQVPNHDGAGIVDAIGTGVDAALLGARVWTWEAAYNRPEGTAQQFAIVPARQVVPLPAHATFDLGASLGVPFITAHRCLTVTEAGPRQLGPGTLNGRVVLVSGGAGAVGNAAIQLARWSDATVIATISSPAKAQLAAAAGADHVINYQQQDVVAEVGRITERGIDTIVEVSAAQNASIDAAMLARLGSVSIYSNNGGDQFTLPIRPLMSANARWQFVLLYNAPHEAKARAVHDITSAIRDDALHVGESFGLPLHHFPLTEADKAHAAVQNSITGKVLIDVAE